MLKPKDLILSLPNKFDGTGLEEESAIFNFNITGTEGGDYTVSIDKGVCTVVEGMSDSADCTIKSSEENLTKIINKDLNAQMALFTGKLKISNLGIMMKYAKKFGLM